MGRLAQRWPAREEPDEETHDRGVCWMLLAGRSHVRPGAFDSARFHRRPWLLWAGWSLQVRPMRTTWTGERPNDGHGQRARTGPDEGHAGRHGTRRSGLPANAAVEFAERNSKVRREVVPPQVRAPRGLVSRGARGCIFESEDGRAARIHISPHGPWPS